VKFSLKRKVRHFVKRAQSSLQVLRVTFERDLTKQDKKLKKSILLKFINSSRRFGKFMPYQSFMRLGLDGQRNTESRIQAYPFEHLQDGMSVLDVGCNMGCLTISLANQERFKSASFVGIDIDVEMIDIANSLKMYNHNRNVTFLNLKLEDFLIRGKSEKFDFILCLAVDFWIGGDFSEFLQNVSSLTRENSLVLIESNNLDYDSVNIRWRAIVKKLLEEGRVIESGTTYDDVKREWILFAV
jgi:2-polyprenyl-3-methyl-5-hydroxy-6-metoxy-1,4-benzoquinol methylase